MTKKKKFDDVRHLLVKVRTLVVVGDRSVDLSPMLQKFLRT
jgi:hypothetical protein